MIALFRGLVNAKATFATKYVNRDMLAYDPQGKTRIRFSLMPDVIARITDVRTSPIAERISAINDFLAAGYQVNINFGPVIYYENWLKDYAELFAQIDGTISEPAKAQLAAEIIFLTHNQQLHELNLAWHPKAEALLWWPEGQAAKLSNNGAQNVRYRLTIKRQLVAQFVALLKQKLSYCRVRYAF